MSEQDNEKRMPEREEIRFNAHDLADAWVVGRQHERKYGDTQDDAPDFWHWFYENKTAF